MRPPWLFLLGADSERQPGLHRHGLCSWGRRGRHRGMVALATGPLAGPSARYVYAWCTSWVWSSVRNVLTTAGSKSVPLARRITASASSIVLASL